MENWRKYLSPEDLTDEENTKRVVELLARACLRLIRGEKIDATPISPNPEQRLFGPRPKRGPTKFGYSVTENGIIENEVEMAWIRRVAELVSYGLSSEKIARQLNKEDHTSRRVGKWSRTLVWRIMKHEKDQMK